MINYNPKSWFSLIFNFHRSDTFRILLPTMLSVAAISAIISYLEVEVWQLRHQSTAVLHSLLGFVISMLLVFRTNTAYERWWEGRKLWGSLVNNSRNLAIKLNAMLAGQPEEKQKFARLIADYANVLKNHLQDKKVDGLTPPEAHQPNYIASQIFSEIHGLYQKGHFTGDQLYLLNEEIRSFADVCGACERIRKTPIPYSYSLFIKKFIFVYVMSLPFSFVGDFGYAMIFITPFVLYALASLELIAEEIENPFGTDSNDLPTDEIAATIEQNVTEILA